MVPGIILWLVRWTEGAGCRRQARATALTSGPHNGRSIGRRELDGVVEQVHDHLFNPLRVRGHGGKLVLYVKLQRNPLLVGGGLESIPHLRKKIRHGEVFDRETER